MTNGIQCLIYQQEGLPWQASGESSQSLLPHHTGSLQTLVVVLVVLAGLAAELGEGPL